MVGYKLTESGIFPINTKVQVISDILRPPNLKQLRLFPGSVNEFNKVTPTSTRCYPFRTFFKKDVDWKCEKEYEMAFCKINEELKQIVDLWQFKRYEDIRIICGGAVLEQLQTDKKWRPISFASQFLTDFEMKCSINELELLPIVWALEIFKTFVYWVAFKEVSDRKALASVLKTNYLIAKR